MLNNQTNRRGWIKPTLAKIVLTGTLAFNASVGAVMTLPVHTVAVGAGITVIATLPVTTGFVGCSKDQLIAAGKDVLSTLQNKQLQDALRAVSPALLSKMLAAIPTAERLIELIRTGDFTSATAIINSIFSLVDEVAVVLNANPVVMGFLALANIALHFIINHTQKNVPSMRVPTPAMQQTIEFGSRPAWGCNLRQDKRCAELAH